MKKIALIIVALFAAISMSAQMQQGYVKSLGRPDKKGEPLKGVTVLVKGEHNTVLSKADGTFSILMAGKKNGDAYSLQQVQKSGYELNEKGVIGRKYAFSDKVPLTLVMVSTSQLQADKQRIENKAYEVAQRNYQKKMAELERQRDKNTITAETYRSEAADLREKFERYQLLIDGLAEHYAHTDYDLLTDTEREINLCIEAGDLDRADSLIHTLFDPTDVLQRNHDALAKLDQQIDQANDIIRQANTDMAAVLKQQEKDAEYLYQLYTIALAKYDNEKARYYIETRAELDTKNVVWQLQAGRFTHGILSDNSKALFYYNRTLRKAIIQYGEKHTLVAQCYNNIGLINKEPLAFYEKALSIYEELNDSSNVAVCYNNIGLYYYHQADSAKALNFFRKSLIIDTSLYGDNNEHTAADYNNIAGVYLVQRKPDFALTYLEKSLAIKKNIYGENHPDVALTYNNIGFIYYTFYSYDKNDYSKSLSYYEKSLNIYNMVYGPNNPHITTTYINIGYVYYSKGLYSKALIYFERAYDILRIIYDADNPKIQNALWNIQSVKMLLEELD